MITNIDQLAAALVTANEELDFDVCTTVASALVDLGVVKEVPSGEVDSADSAVHDFDVDLKVMGYVLDKMPKHTHDLLRGFVAGMISTNVGPVGLQQ